MDKSKNNFPFPLLFMVLGLVGVVSFFLLSPRSTGFRWSTFVISSSIFILAMGIGWYFRKKFPPLKRSTQLLVTMIIFALVFGVQGYQLAIDRYSFNFHTFHFRSFFIGFIFASLISLFEQYLKERKTASINPNNKEVL